MISLEDLIECANDASIVLKNNEQQKPLKQIEAPIFEPNLEKFQEEINELTKGKRKQEIAADGNCFFAAISYHQWNTIQYHKDVRQTMIANINMIEPTSWQVWLESNNQTQDQWIEYMKYSGRLVDDLGYGLVSLIYQQNIKIIKDGGANFKDQLKVEYGAQYTEQVLLSWENGNHHNQWTE